MKKCPCCPKNKNPQPPSDDSALFDDLDEQAVAAAGPHIEALQEIREASLKRRKAAAEKAAYDKLSGAACIFIERERQIEKEGWSAEHDDQHTKGELAQAAAAYALQHTDQKNAVLFPWAARWNKTQKHDTLRRLVVAGALIAAEYDRVKRALAVKAESAKTAPKKKKKK